MVELTKLDTSINNIDTIVHLADIHIRLTKRHEEYREAFSKIYDHVKTLSENTLILVAGDVVHSKVDLSPECVQLASDFLKSLADLRPTVLVAGNHDCLLTNNTRLDSLTPIVDALRHKNLHYLKKTGLFGFANILFNNYSVFDDPTKYIDYASIPKKIRNQYDTSIALFHGGVNGTLTDIGYIIENKIITTSMFDGHDMVLLGDIHKAQTFYITKKLNTLEADAFAAEPEADQWEVVESECKEDLFVFQKKKSPIFRYCGSTIQQNHGETLIGHGFSVWNVADRSFKHVEIPNDYGYFTIDIVDGKLVTDITAMPSKPKLRVRCKESVASEVKKIVAEIRQSREITELVYQRVDGDDAKKQSDSQASANLSKITDVSYQNTLIESYLKAKFPEVMDEDTLTVVKEINKTMNSELSKDDQTRNIRWKPIKFEFSNMFSYGENNVIDFTKLSDVYGLFAANASGKSSLADALCFTIFDKSARAFKASNVINSQKMSFHGKFTFEINGIQYVIDRRGTRDKKNNVKVDVNFYKLSGTEEISLNSEARRSTNEIIRDYLGSYDDFVLTSLALQGNQGSFIDMGQTERKELLSQFIGLNIFDKLSLTANNRMKELSGVLKIFNKEDTSKKILDMEDSIGLLDGKIEDLTERKGQLLREKESLEGDIQAAKAKIVSLENVPTDVEPLRKEKTKLEEDIEERKSLLKQATALTESETKTKEDVERKMAAFDIPDINDKCRRYDEALQEQTKLERSLDKLKTLVASKLTKLDHLKKHEYDPNCKFCCNNVFVKDAKDAEASLPKDKETAIELKASLAKVRETMVELKPALELNAVVSTLKRQKADLVTSIYQQSLKSNTYEKQLAKDTARLEEVNGLIDLYERSKEAVETNKGIEKTISGLTMSLNKVLSQIKSVNADYMDAYSKKVSFTDQVAQMKTRIEEIQKTEDEFAGYQYYLTCVGKDGIPYQIISDAIPRIEQEVNNILSQIVEFTMGIETDGKNVNVLIKYEDKKWPLELCSGMEKFISALALRVALINISNLPRAPFLVVDEGFGALDADNMAMVHALFDYLKTNFEFIIVISHLDQMRDMVDKQLEIKKENGFSKIDNTK